MLLLTSLAGCAPKESSQAPEPDSKTEPEAQTLILNTSDYPRIDGSTATIPLSEAVASKVLQLPLEEARQYVVHNTTPLAYENLMARKVNLIFVTSPSEEEQAMAKEKGIQLEVIPVVNEGFVFLVNAKNPVSSLTMEQIRGIYSGEITNWKEVGGDDKGIVAFQRPVNSGSQTGMLDLVIGKEEIMEPPMERVIAEMGQLIDAVAVYNNETDAIGYSYYYFATDMWNNEAVKLLSVEGIAPDKDSISKGTYPVMTAYYAVMRSDEPADSNARKLVDWIRSEQGQNAVEEAGYVRMQK